MVKTKTVKKIETVEETRSRTFKPIYVQSWAQSSFPKETRLLIYSMRTAIPLTAEAIQLEPVEQCESSVIGELGVRPIKGTTTLHWFQEIFDSATIVLSDFSWPIAFCHLPHGIADCTTIEGRLRA
jgi:hypothetical protein